MIQIPNPHDRFFREVLGRADRGREFVAQYLPAEVVRHLDLETLEVVSESFVDPALAEYHSDLLYRVELAGGGPGYVYLLFEHKSYPDPWVPFQLLRYLVRVWERVRKPRSPLPPVVPVVFYHGRRPWREPLDFAELVGGPPDLRPHTPAFRPLLCDLSRYDDDELRGAVLLRAALLLQKHIFAPDLGERLPGILRLVADAVTEPTALGALEVFLNYAASGSDLDLADLKEALETALPEHGGAAMPTLAEKWIEEGIQQGIQQGIQRGLERGAHRAVLEVLETRFGVVPVSVTQALAQVPGEDVLSMLHKRAVSVESLEAFRADLQKALS